MITSTTNQHVKTIRSLGNSRKDRQRERLFVLEGVRLIATALAAGATLALALYDPEQLASTPAGVPLLAQLEQLPTCYPASERVLAVVTDTVNPQGVVAVATIPHWDLAAVQAQPSGVLLVLDSLQDPGNAGTLLRSAQAAGVQAVLTSSGTTDLYSPKVVRSAMGAHFSVPIFPDLPWDDIRAVQHRLHGAAGAIYAADAGGSLPYYAANWQQPATLIVGNEAHGISDAARSAATALLTIPMHGATESLNAAIAGSVILFEALRQRRV